MNTPEEQNAANYLQMVPAPTIADIATGRIDTQRLARKEMANRGLGMAGEWVGFEKARTLWEIGRPCSVCDNTGDVHRADGEYAGICPSCGFNPLPPE